MDIGIGVSSRAVVLSLLRERLGEGLLFVMTEFVGGWCFCVPDGSPCYSTKDGY